MPETERNNEEMPTYYGDLARETWARAQAEKDPMQRKMLLKEADAASRAREAELERNARAACWITKPEWIVYMPVNRLPGDILGRIYSFQAGKKNGVCRLSLNSLAAQVGTSRRRLIDEVNKLVEAGYLDKVCNGDRKPSSYRVIVPTCMEAAIANGWKESKAEPQKQEAQG